VSTVDFDARMARYRRQNGRLTVTARQMRRAMRKFGHQAVARQKRLLAALDVPDTKGGATS